MTFRRILDAVLGRPSICPPGSDHVSLDAVCVVKHIAEHVVKNGHLPTSEEIRRAERLLDEQNWLAGEFDRGWRHDRHR